MSDWKQRGDTANQQTSLKTGTAVAFGHPRKRFETTSPRITTWRNVRLRLIFFSSSTTNFVPNTNEKQCVRKLQVQRTRLPLRAPTSDAPFMHPLCVPLLRRDTMGWDRRHLGQDATYFCVPPCALVLNTVGWGGTSWPRCHEQKNCFGFNHMVLLPKRDNAQKDTAHCNVHSLKIHYYQKLSKKICCSGE